MKWNEKIKYNQQNVGYIHFTFNFAAMIKNNGFYKYIYFVLIVIFLVIIAGSVVRTTQSGMGCPDWPKCFGQYIPPTKMEQVIFTGNKTYKKGQFIIYRDSLKYAKNTFTSTAAYHSGDWLPYLKHNNASFEVYKTWIEYINRLLGALLGLFILIQVIWSFRYRKEDRSYFVLSLLLLFLTGFQAWLGKTVVDSNLAVLKISLHLAGAIGMLLLQLLILNKINNKNERFPLSLIKLLYLLMFLQVVQLFLGVMVRQEIDLVAESKFFTNRGSWLEATGFPFYIHRSFSLLLLGLSGFIFYRFKTFMNIPLFRLFFACMLLQILTGVAFIYFDFPAFAQPVHLVLSCILLSSLFLLLLRKKQVQ